MGFNIQQYEQAIAKNGGDSWYNATGYTKEELISKIRTAKDSVEKLTKERDEAQISYDEANARNCKDRCGKGNNAPCHPKCDTKTADKDKYLPIYLSAIAEINRNTANIPAWQTELDDLIEKEANTPAPNSDGGTPSSAGTPYGAGTSNTGGGTSTTTGGGTTAKKSNTVLYASIGGAVLILGIVGYFVFRKK